jgi:toxin secretion/phage lysis holin
MNQILFNTMAGASASLLTYAFGGWSDLLGFFLLVIVIDYITGVSASLKEGKGLNSEVGFWGLCKKVLMLVVIALAHRADIVMDTEILMIGAIYFYLANELISITENYGRLGLPLPDNIKKLIAVLKDRGESG